MLQNILQNVLFFFINFSHGNFIYHLNFFILTKNLNTAHTATAFLLTFFPTTFLQLFVSLVRLLNIILDEYSLFLSHAKSVFFNDDRK